VMQDEAQDCLRVAGSVGATRAFSRLGLEGEGGIVEGR
jgi:hypothetical protein